MIAPPLHFLPERICQKAAAVRRRTQPERGWDASALLTARTLLICRINDAFEDYRKPANRDRKAALRFTLRSYIAAYRILWETALPHVLGQPRHAH